MPLMPNSGLSEVSGAAPNVTLFGLSPVETVIPSDSGGIMHLTLFEGGCGGR